ncbi:Ldh family oxidoreductase [Naasia sp. SYSU D00057]|uniref:Ldh family oxidoreductase n=1 Tax=Naasia sp. SYSU D00057 TaxID=2817380 RepID=UPI001B306177|nr:Ldh family oxidoreductase [Naasia sp. SYSU D00057]
MTGITVPADRLVELGAAILVAHGVPEDDARLVADSLVTADMWGHPSHGMLRLDWYVARLRAGVMTAVTEPETVLDGGAVVVLDGRDGVGQIATERACALAVDRARQHGIGLVAVRFSNHFGTAAYWTRRIADAGCVGILTTNGSPAMAPWGGREKTVGANPWSIATPGGSHGPVVLDIANTGVARGKIYAALQKGESIPDTWAIDSSGTPTTDPRAAIEGILLPMAGHKGYGISFMMDVLSGVLTGSGYATDVVGPYVPDQRSGCGHLVVAIDIDRILGRDEFDRRIDDLIARTKSVPLAAGVSEVFYPGEIENRAEERGRAEGVFLPDKTVDELKSLAVDAGVPFDLVPAEVV